MVNKQELIKFLIQSLSDDLFQAKEIANSIRSEAIDEESKPENEYDTRALEASYLAGAQSKRVVEIEELISVIRNLKILENPENKIVLGSLVEVELESKSLFLFVLTKGGGKTVNFDGKSIQIVSSNSPLGEALMGLQAGDDAIVDTGKREFEYSIKRLL